MDLEKNIRGRQPDRFDGLCSLFGLRSKDFSDLVPLVYQYPPKTSESRTGRGEKVLGISEAEKPIPV